jgi:hypothetical protein
VQRSVEVGEQRGCGETIASMPRFFPWILIPAALIVGWFWGDTLYGPIKARFGEAGLFWFIGIVFGLAVVLKIVARQLRRLGMRRLAAYRAQHPDIAE